MTHLKEDITAVSRKKDHIDLAFESARDQSIIDTRFSYEPLLAAHPNDLAKEFSFLNKKMNAPVWVSSMTGGTDHARHINKQLASVCKDFGLGMGLGSCRSLLFDDEYLSDFAVRNYIDDQPLYANLGIAQVEELLDSGQIVRIKELINKLDADGLIVHINPFQEWLQPEGDIIKNSPLDTIKRLIDKIDTSIIVKEVGQGMGRASLSELLQLPIDAIEFAAHGGTNFSMLEMMRADKKHLEAYECLASIGHSAIEMVRISNELKVELGDKIKCNQLIISGGVKNFLDGYYLNACSDMQSIYGQASSFLKHAMGDYESLYAFAERQIKGYRLAEAYLKIKK